MTRSAQVVACAIAVASAVAVTAAPAAAHNRSLGRSIIAIDDDRGGADVRVTLSLLDRDALYAHVGGPAGLPAALTSGLALVGPGGPCVATAPTELPAVVGDAAYHWRVRCPAPPDRLVCALLVDVVPGHVHLARVIARGRGVVVALAAEQRQIALDQPAAATRWTGFVRLGGAHVIGGVDHLLFLLTLLLVAGSLRELTVAATGFTIGHSAALALAVAAGARPSSAGIEVLVAASIVVVAAEAAAARAGRRGRHVPVAVALGLATMAAVSTITGGPAPLALAGFAGLAAGYLAGVERSSGPTLRIAITALFGLVHGFAFAGPLADLALPGPALAAALLGFNLGIELAQLAVLALGWLVLAWARRWAPAAAGLALDVAAALAIAPAIYWVVTRAA